LTRAAVELGSTMVVEVGAVVSLRSDVVSVA